MNVSGVHCSIRRSRIPTPFPAMLAFWRWMPHPEGGPAPRQRGGWPSTGPTACLRCGGADLFCVSSCNNVLIYVLLGAAVVTAILQHWVDTGVILAVVLANAVIGFLQEGKAEAAMAAIRKMLTPRAALLRDGQRLTVDGAEIVPGDIALLEAGD